MFIRVLSKVPVKFCLERTSRKSINLQTHMLTLRYDLKSKLLSAIESIKLRLRNKHKNVSTSTDLGNIKTSGSWRKLKIPTHIWHSATGKWRGSVQLNNKATYSLHRVRFRHCNTNKVKYEAGEPLSSSHHSRAFIIAIYIYTYIYYNNNNYYYYYYYYY
jgi:hypothetical protein